MEGMATPTPTVSLNEQSLNDEMKSAYKGLSEEVLKYYQDQQQKFEEESQKEYTSPEHYQKDRTAFTIDTKIKDLDKQRKDIWEFLSKQYDENTKNKYRNAQVIINNRQELERQTKEIKKLKQNLDHLKNDANLSRRTVEFAEYQKHKYDHRIYLMKAYLLILMMLLGSVIIADTFGISKKPVVYANFFVLTCLICYTFYHFYLNRPNRDDHSWSKLYFEQPPIKKPKSPNGPETDEVSNIPEEDLTDFSKLDKELDKKMKKYVMGKCVEKPPPS